MVGIEEKRKADLVDMMPDLEATLRMHDTLHRIDKLHPESRMPFLLGERPEINCTVFRRHAWQKPNDDKLC